MTNPRAPGASSSGNFDPYYQWLGIPPTEQPANHYRLLGIPQYEADPRVIDNAADRQMNHVRTFQLSAHKDESQRLLNELSAARVCLLNAGRKREYDAALRAREQQAEAARRAAAAKLTSAPQHRVNPTSQGGYQLAGDTAPAFDAAAWDAPMASAAPVYAPVSFGRRPFWKEPHWMAVIVAGVLALLGGMFVLGMILSRPATPPADTEYADNTPQPGANDSGNSAAGTGQNTAVQHNSTANNSTTGNTDGNKADAGSSTPPTSGDNSIGDTSASGSSPGSSSSNNSDENALPANAEAVMFELMKSTLGAFNFEEGTYTRESEKSLRFPDLGPSNVWAVNRGMPTFEPGIAGQAVALNGNSALRMPELRPHFYYEMKSSFTVAFWRKCNKQDFGYLFDVGFYPDACVNIQTGDSGKIQVTCGGKNRFTTAKSLWTDQWQHLAMVFDSTSIALYADGVRVEYWSIPRTVLNNKLVGEASSYIGTCAIPDRQPGKYFNGTIDEWLVVGKAATDEEIQTIYQWGKAGRPLPVAAYAEANVEPPGVDVNVAPPPAPLPPADPETEAKILGMMRTAITMVNFEPGTYSREKPSYLGSPLILEDLGPGRVTAIAQGWSPEFVPGQAGHAFRFNGEGRWLRFPELRTALYEFGQRGFTMSFWMKCAMDKQIYAIFNSGKYPSACVHIRCETNKSLEICYGQGGYLLRSPAGAITGQWQHIVVAFDRTRFTLWIDGERINSSGVGTPVELNEATIAPTTTSVGYPMASAEKFFRGEIDEFVVLPGIAQDADVRLFYEWGKAGRPLPSVDDVDPPADDGKADGNADGGNVGDDGDGGGDAGGGDLGEV